MTSVFVDTGGWIALLKRDDSDHTRAVQRYQMLSSGGAHLVTSNYIVDETGTRLRYDVGLKAALGFRELLLRAGRQGRVETVWVDEQIEEESWLLLGRYADLELSLTDATSAVISRRRKLVEIFGLDRHFEALGLTVLPG